MPLYLIALIAFSVALLASLAIVFTKHLHGAHTLDESKGIQKMHSKPTPRIGGIAVAAGFLMAWAVADGETGLLLGLIGLAGLPAFGFGFAEDLTKRVGVRARLLATIASGIIFAIITGYSITSLQIPAADAVLAYPLLAIMFTGFAMGGAANAINLIDGFHGLAAGTVILILLAFSVVGWRVGDPEISSVSLIMTAVMGGFFVVNFPSGRLFLGDAGAYFSGYVVAGIAVMLPARNPEISPWVSLLILAYPVTETLISIIRRFVRKGAQLGAPDDRHLHHIVHMRVKETLPPRTETGAFPNAITSLFMWVLPLLTLVFVGLGDLQVSYILVYLVLIVVLYISTYRAIMLAQSSG